jgi:hypothetical protein
LRLSRPQLLGALVGGTVGTLFVWSLILGPTEQLLLRMFWRGVVGSFPLDPTLVMEEGLLLKFGIGLLFGAGAGVWFVKGKRQE